MERSEILWADKIHCTDDGKFTLCKKEIPPRILLGSPWNHPKYSRTLCNFCWKVLAKERR